MLPFDLKRSFTKTLTRFHCRLDSDHFKNPSNTEHFTFNSGTELYWFRSRNCFENSIPSVSRSPYSVHFLRHSVSLPGTVPEIMCRYKINLVQSDWRNTLRTRCTSEKYKTWVHHRLIVFELWHKRLKIYYKTV